MPTTKKISKTYSDAADWNDSLCGVKHKINVIQEGNKIRIKLDAWKDYPSSDIIGNLQRGKWDKDNSSSIPHSIKIWIKDIGTGEHFVGNNMGDGVEVYAGDSNLYEWSAEYPSTYEVRWVENSTSICRSLGYADSERFYVSDKDVGEDRSNTTTQDTLDRVGVIFTGIIGLTLVYTIYRIIK